MAKFYPTLGTMIAKRDKETGDAILDKNKKATYYIKRDKNKDGSFKHKIVIDGKEFKGDFLNVSRPRDKLDRMLENGKLDKKEHAEKVARFEKGGDLDYMQFG